MKTTSETLDSGPFCPPWRFADRLRRARDLHGLTQRQMAAAIGESEAAYQNWESRGTLPRNVLSVARRMALATGVSLNWLLAQKEGGDVPDMAEVKVIRAKTLTEAIRRGELSDSAILELLLLVTPIDKGASESMDQSESATGAAPDAERRKQTELMQQRRSATHPAAGADTPSWTPVGHVA
jgi:transcriptional regulator with XRE-family HTH domain